MEHVWVILKDYGSEGLRPLSAYTDQDRAYEALTLLEASGMGVYVMWSTVGNEAGVLTACPDEV